MYTKWTEHLTDPKDQEFFRNQVRAAKPVLERLSQLISDEVANTERSESNPKIYDISNWAFLQADMNGYKRGMKYISKLIDLDQQDQKRNSNDREFSTTAD